MLILLLFGSARSSHLHRVIIEGTEGVIIICLGVLECNSAPSIFHELLCRDPILETGWRSEQKGRWVHINRPSVALDAIIVANRSIAVAIV